MEREEIELMIAVEIAANRQEELLSLKNDVERWQRKAKLSFDYAQRALDNYRSRHDAENDTAKH